MAQSLPLDQATATFVKDGQTVAREGSTHLILFAAPHQAIRQCRGL